MQRSESEKGDCHGFCGEQQRQRTSRANFTLRVRHPLPLHLFEIRVLARRNADDGDDSYRHSGGAER
jgi:hypothetical protein